MGRAVVIPNGIQIGKYLIPSACRHCDDSEVHEKQLSDRCDQAPPGRRNLFSIRHVCRMRKLRDRVPIRRYRDIDTPTFDRAQSRKAEMMNDSDFFFRPYPVAQHDVGEEGLLKRLFGSRKGSKRKPETLEGGRDFVTSGRVPIKCDLCDGLPFMGCVHNCPTGAAIRFDPAKLFEDYRRDRGRISRTPRRAEATNPKLGERADRRGR